MMRLLLCLLVAVTLGWATVTALRTGKVHNRGGVIKRASHPVAYWTSVIVGMLFALTALAVGLGLIPF